jgi:hypothetical protein
LEARDHVEPTRPPGQHEHTEAHPRRGHSDGYAGGAGHDDDDDDDEYVDLDLDLDYMSLQGTALVDYFQKLLIEIADADTDAPRRCVYVSVACDDMR